MRPNIRLAADSDAAEILEIYAPIVKDTATSFEVEPPSLDEMRARIRETLDHYPWLVCAHDHVFGYAYAGKHRVRAAYQWSADVSVYVHRDARHKGIGQGLYRSLLGILVLQGYENAFAGITLPNAASVGLHESFGFSPVGIYKSVGYKLGSWHDVGWWQLRLTLGSETPGELKTLAEVNNTVAFQSAIESGQVLIKSSR